MPAPTRASRDADALRQVCAASLRAEAADLDHGPIRVTRSTRSARRRTSGTFFIEALVRGTFFVLFVTSHDLTHFRKKLMKSSLLAALTALRARHAPKADRPQLTFADAQANRTPIDWDGYVPPAPRQLGIQVSAGGATSTVQTTKPAPGWEKALLEKANHPALPRVVDSFVEGSTEYLIEEVPAGRCLCSCATRPGDRHSGPIPTRSG